MRFSRQFLFRSLAVFFALALSTLVIEAGCYLLNRSRWKDFFRHYPSSAELLATRSIFKYEIPNSAKDFPGVSGPRGSWPPVAQNLSRKIGRGFVRLDPITSVPVSIPGTSNNSVVTALDTGKLIYDVRYNVGQDGRRLTPQKRLEFRKHHLLMLGCSFVFGEGLNDEDTLPTKLAARAPGFHVYNSGFFGYSPASLLLESRFSSLMENLREKSGIAVYMFIDDHVRRVFGSMSIMNEWGMALPYVTVSENGETNFHGSFKNGRPFLTAIYGLIMQTEAQKFFNFDFPIFSKGGRAHEFALYVKALKEAYRQKTGSDRFYVIFHPSSRIYAQAIMPELDRMQIPFLNYSALDLASVTADPTTIPYDGHPTANTNEIISKLIQRDLLDRIQ